MIVAAALPGGCETLYSEELQDGLLIDNQLRIAIHLPFIVLLKTEGILKNLSSRNAKELTAKFLTLKSAV